MVIKLSLQNPWPFLRQRLSHLYNPPPPPPPQQPPVPMVAIDIGRSIPQSPPSNLNDGPAPNNIIASPSIHFHPITLLIRELGLGKSLLNIGVPITIAVLISNDANKFHTTFVYLMLSGLSIGSMTIWNGIALRSIFPRAANVVEQLGILMVLLSFTGLLGSALPPAFTWVTILCSALSFMPFLFQAFSYCTPNQIQTDAS